MRTASVRPVRAAVRRTVSLPAIVLFGSAPASSSVRSISALPLTAASDKGVTSKALAAISSALAAISSRARSIRFRRAAQCRAVAPSGCRASTSAPAFSTARTATASPCRTASISGASRPAPAAAGAVPSTRALNQTGHVEGLPFGTRGGTTVPYTFPVDADYELRVELGKSWNSNRVGGLRRPHDVVITLDGEPVEVLTVTPQPRGGRGQSPQYQPVDRPADADLAVRIRVTAGPHVIGAAFVDRDPGLVERHRQPFLKVHITVGGDQRTQPNVYSVTVTGPFDASGPGDTPSRRRIFTCRPADATADAEEACATEVLSTLARRAYRRPVTGADVAVLVRFYREGRTGGDFESGIEMALQRLLVSPEFLLRVERDPDGVDADRPYFVSDLELASRLSFFLWSSLPDDALIEAAAAGTLREPAVLESHVRRTSTRPCGGRCGGRRSSFSRASSARTAARSIS